MKTALIGHTGFVGGNLLRQTDFTDCFNSKNIRDIAGRSYDLLVCSGARAEKWKANKDPEADRRHIDELMAQLAGVAVERLILISTVDVYPEPLGVDEATPIDLERSMPYGRHRRLLEMLAEHRPDALIVRLPGLFGPGLKKNIIYDFIHVNAVDNIHADSQFQFYNLAHLWRDIQTALKNELKLVNFATEPVTVAEVARQAFSRDFQNRPPGAPAKYDMKSRHCALYGGSNGYLYSRPQVLAELKQFVANQEKS